MTILKNILLIILPAILIIAIANIVFGLESLTAMTLDPVPRVFVPVVSGAIIFFYVLFLFKITPIKVKSTMISCVIGLIVSILFFPYLIGLLPIPFFASGLTSEAGVASIVFVLAYIFCIISYKKETNF